jgi:hypothetical protein
MTLLPCFGREEVKKVHLSKKRIAIIGFIITLITTNVALAYMYMNKDVMISGGVKASGAIAIYQEDGVTELTDLNFPLFEGSTHSASRFFFLKNTGNLPVNVYWSISSSNPAFWSLESGGQAYVYTEETQTKFRFSINKQILPNGNPGNGEIWYPDPTGTQFLTIDVGQSAKLAMDLLHYTAVNTPSTFSFVLSFYA